MDPMRFAMARSVLIGIALTASPVIPAPGQAPDAKARALEVLDQARAALGGRAALEAVHSLSGSGDFRTGSDSSAVSGEVQLDVLLPDKLMRTMKWSPGQAMKVTSVEVVNGEDVWADAKAKQPSQALGGAPAGGGGMGRGGRRSMGGGGGGVKVPGVSGPAPQLEEGRDSRQMRLDSSCLIMGLLLRFPDSAKAELSYAGDGDILGAKVDFVKIATGDGLAISLALDRKTHRPVMASYNASMADATGEGQSQDQAETADVQIYFSEYKAIALKRFGDIWLPWQITRTLKGQTVEDMHIKKFQLNPSLKPKQFEKKG
jgi:hypothetical protein